MGWKSTWELTRQEAEELVFRALAHIREWTADELESVVETVARHLNHHGHNFLIVEKPDNKHLGGE